MSKTLSRGAVVDERPAEGALIEHRLERVAADLDETARRYTLALREAEGQPFRRALLLAEGIRALREAIRPEFMQRVMTLMNSPLGFTTDRGPQASNAGQREPYPTEVVKDAFIASLLQGFYPTNNEWGIIKGRFYGQQAGWKRKLETVPGISDIRIAAGVPLLHNGRVVVRVALSWRLDGTRASLVGTDGKPGIAFPVAVHGESWTADQVIGKAKRKAFKAAFEQATGSRHSADEDDGEDAGEMPPLPAGAAPALPGGRRGAGDELKELRLVVSTKATNLDMDDAAVTHLAERLHADPNTAEGLQVIGAELDRIIAGQLRREGLEDAEEGQAD